MKSWFCDIFELIEFDALIKGILEKEGFVMIIESRQAIYRLIFYLFIAVLFR